MNDLVINNNSISIKEFDGQRVITFKDIDKVHNRPEGTASRNFKDNRSKFIKGTDYYMLKPDVASIDEIRPLKIPPRGLTLLTQTGYLMLAKSLTDDLAWKVQRELVNSYFNVRLNALPIEKPKLPEPAYEYRPKYHNGVLVVTIKDLEHFIHISRGMIGYYLRQYRKRFVGGVDYWLLEGNELMRFKEENTHMTKLLGSLIIISESGFRKLAKIIKGVPKKLDCFKIAEKKPKEVQNADEAEPMNEMHYMLKSLQEELVALGVMLKKLDRYNTPMEQNLYLSSIGDLGNSIWKKTSLMEVFKLQDLEGGLSVYDLKNSPPKVRQRICDTLSIGEQYISGNYAGFMLPGMEADKNSHMVLLP